VVWCVFGVFHTAAITLSIVTLCTVLLLLPQQQLVLLNHVVLPLLVLKP
jgi:hypothetical protein